MFDVSVLAERILVADGGWSTQLQIRGVPATEMAELANLTHPDLVRDLARAYADAGARFVTTNTFATNRFTLERRDVTHTITELNEAGARLNREAATGADVWVAGSIGPSGKMLTVRETTEEELRPMFAEQSAALAKGGADVIVLETFSEIAEMVVAIDVVKETTGLPVIASMSFDSGPQRTRTMMGARAEDCATALDEAGADVVGCNCGGGIEHMLPVVVALRSATTKPLWAKPNAGMPELEEGKTVWKQTPEQFVAHAPQLLDAGVNIIGGCCGTGPEHIAKLAALVARRSG